jgi:hypothetical protein
MATLNQTVNKCEVEKSVDDTDKLWASEDGMPGVETTNTRMFWGSHPVSTKLAVLWVVDLMIAAVQTSETLVNLLQRTRRYSPAGSRLQLPVDEPTKASRNDRLSVRVVWVYVKAFGWIHSSWTANKYYLVRFEILTAASIKTAIFREVAPRITGRRATTSVRCLLPPSSGWYASEMSVNV